MVSDDGSRRRRFEEIYDAYSGLILAYATRRTSDATEGADIVADTFAVAWRRIDDVPAGDEARPWLYGVSRRVVANHRRSDTRRRSLETRLAFEFRDVGVVAGAGDLEALTAAFSALSDDDRELLTLVGWDGLGRDEIATMLGCSRATVRVRLHRARQRFDRQLTRAGVTRSVAGGHGAGGWAVAHPDPEEA